MVKKKKGYQKKDTSVKGEGEPSMYNLVSTTKLDKYYKIGKQCILITALPGEQSLLSE